MRVINLSTVSTKKEEPKKKETAAAILSILSVQPQGLTPVSNHELLDSYINCAIYPNHLRRLRRMSLEQL